jgi:uncharacterized protein YdeI (YjbR/CyaY-like superfamily)
VTVADEPVHAFPSAAAWERWLERNHDSGTGLWLRIATKASGTPTVSYDEAVEVALCFGWIDGAKRKGDEGSWQQRFTPRRARSRWSRINRDRAERLATEGRLRPAGLREVEAARADGRWEAAYASQSVAEVPADLAEALDRAGVAATFAALRSAERYAVLYRVAEAKRPETRARRIATFVDRMARGEAPTGPVGPTRARRSST